MEGDKIFYDLMKAYLAQMDSALKISNIVYEHSGEERKEEGLTGDDIICGLIYRLMIPMTKEEMQKALQEYDCFCPTVTDNVNSEVLSVENKRAKIVASFGVGFNHIDLDAAKKEGLVVTNTPEVLTDCTADLAMSLLLSAARRTGEGERELRAGK